MNKLITMAALVAATSSPIALFAQTSGHASSAVGEMSNTSLQIDFERDRLDEHRTPDGLQETSFAQSNGALNHAAPRDVRREKRLTREVVMSSYSPPIAAVGR
ncbi:hypothetical protein VSR69_39425 [Paraburkholderia phytofirmans]